MKSWLKEEEVDPEEDPDQEHVTGEKESEEEAGEEGKYITLQSIVIKCMRNLCRWRAFECVVSVPQSTWMII